MDGPALKSAAGGIAGLHLERFKGSPEMLLLSEQLEPLRKRKQDIQNLLETCASAETALLNAKSGVKNRADEFEQFIFTAAFLRKLAQLRLSEMENDLPDAKLRQELCHGFESACLKRRAYAGAQAEEPQRGQIGKYWQDTDNPVELLARLSAKVGLI